jgi:predicted phosphoribosyltransferase
MRAALMWARRKQPAEIVAAIPVSTRDAVAMMMNLADHVECLHMPEDFSSVGEFYTNFEEISDDRVCRLLESFQQEGKDISNRF